ncbi:MAG TPA: YceI family protein [Casimicrobiaceae bacterium]|nr:YceI family protein [Casimicrobiaceae bacterium]
MIKQFVAAAAAAIVAIGASAQETYNIDPVHSQPSFEVQHMGFSIQRGSFMKSTGKVTIDRAAKKGSIDVTIDATSIRTIDPRLDTHVKSPDFFNVEKYPTISFKSTDLVFDGDRVVEVNGELTLLGITKPVVLKVTNERCGEHPINKKPMCGAEATTTVKRSEWGMKYGLPRAVGDDVRIVIPIEAYQEQAG